MPQSSRVVKLKRTDTGKVIKVKVYGDYKPVKSWRKVASTKRGKV